MQKNKKLALMVLSVALLEGFTSLGVELYALRIAGLFIGSNTMITGTILAMVLLAIAGGYYWGGLKSKSFVEDNPNLLLKKSSLALLASAVVYTICYIIQVPMLYALTEINIHPILIAAIIGLMFGGGVFLGCLSVPLISMYFAAMDKEKNMTGRYTGLMVALTTIGNVIGSMCVPIFLIPFLGLNLTMLLMICCVLIASMLMAFAGKMFNRPFFCICMWTILVANVFYLSKFVNDGISTKTTTWIVTEHKDKESGNIYRSMTDNVNVQSSCWNVVEQNYCNAYTQKLHDIFLSKKDDIKTVSAIGGAGMVLPYLIARDNSQIEVEAVDLDGDLLKLTSTYFLQKEMPSNFHFIGKDGRDYFNHLNKKVDLAIIDAFSFYTVPSNLNSIEGLTQIREKAKWVTANIILKKGDYKYNEVLINTWSAAFPELYILKVTNNENLDNYLFCNFKCDDEAELVQMTLDRSLIQTDDKPLNDFYGFKIY